MQTNRHRSVDVVGDLRSPVEQEILSRPKVNALIGIVKLT
jgi:hypothetical protein